MEDCCRRYVDEALSCIEDWAREARESLAVGRIHDDVGSVSNLVHCIEGYDHAGQPLGDPFILRRIVDRGEPCPWHNGNVPEDYLAALAALRDG